MKFRERRFFTPKETGARRKCSFLHGQLNHIANKKIMKILRILRVTTGFK